MRTQSKVSQVTLSVVTKLLTPQLLTSYPFTNQTRVYPPCKCVHASGQPPPHHPCAFKALPAVTLDATAAAQLCSAARPYVCCDAAHIDMYQLMSREMLLLKAAVCNARLGKEYSQA